MAELAREEPTGRRRRKNGLLTTILARKQVSAGRSIPAHRKTNDVYKVLNPLEMKRIIRILE
jgi:hypothetical protein